MKALTVLLGMLFLVGCADIRFTPHPYSPKTGGTIEYEVEDFDFINDANFHAAVEKMYEFCGGEFDVIYAEIEPRRTGTDYVGVNRISQVSRMVVPVYFDYVILVFNCS